jgi:hypothetical protein
MEPSKLSNLSPPSCAISLVGRARASEGHVVLQATRPQPPFCAINPDELPFQEGRPLDSSDEEEGWITKSSLPDCEVFMAFIDEISLTEADGSDRVQLDDYYLDDDDYISDAPATPNHDTCKPPEFALKNIDAVKKENKDGMRNKRCKLRNTKHAERRHRIVEQHQQGQATSMTPPRVTSALSSTPTGSPGRPQHHRLQAAGAR